MTEVHSLTFLDFDPKSVPSPCFVVDEVAIENNLRILSEIQEKSGAKILLALKAFSMFSLAPLIRKHLVGCCASGLHEAKLAREEFGGEVHTYSAAFKASEFDEIALLSDHLVFNSYPQWQRFLPQIQKHKKNGKNLECGLRINPMHSEGTTEIYDPCAAGSRLGIPINQITELDLEGIDGLHFHTLCEQGFEPLDRTLAAIEKVIPHHLEKMKWINFGGGHHITADDYNRPALIERIVNFQKKYKVQVYLEPGEAIAINTGVLISEVLDLVSNSMNIAILDASATCHMPDTLEMPYRAHIFNSAEKNKKLHTYRLGGQSCLAGDVMGDYSFDKSLEIGDRLVFDDMSHYTMVKTTTFNGIALPSIAIWNSKTNKLSIIKSFDHESYKSRLS